MTVNTSRPVHADEPETETYVCIHAVSCGYTFERNTKARAYSVTLAGQPVNDAGSPQIPSPSFEPSPMLDRWSREKSQDKMPISEFFVQQGLL